MTRYTIENTKSGAVLGTYDADDEIHAYRLLMADAGYRTEHDAQSAGYTLAEVPDDLHVYEA